MAVHELDSNPIRQARGRLGQKTLQEFADECGVHLQAVYLPEQAVYPDPLPSILSYLENHGFDPQEIRTQYTLFQTERRRKSGEEFNLSRIKSLGVPILTQHPFIAFRKKLFLARLAFAKRFCVHPAALYKLENGDAIHLPEQLRDALQQAGLLATVIDELNSRSEEFAGGAWDQPIRAAN